jgi:hypothetical protein
MPFREKVAPLKVRIQGSVSFTSFFAVWAFPHSCQWRLYYLENIVMHPYSRR